MVKGLPLAYNRDLQEDREALFDAVNSTYDAVEIMADVYRTVTFQSDRFETELVGDPSLATELADHLAANDVPFREAHEAVGRLVRWADESGSTLADLDSESAGRFHPGLASAPLDVLLDPRAAAERRTSLGGTAWREIEAQVVALRADHDRGPSPS